MHSPPVLHLGWQRVRAAFRGAGLPTDGFLVDTDRSFHRAPGPDDVVDFFQRESGRASPTWTRCFVASGDETAGVLVLGFAAMLPELFGLHLDVIRGRLVAGELETRVHDLGSTVAIDDLARAINRLLDKAGTSTRLLPLDSDHRAAYLAVSPEQAVRLDGADIFGEALPDLFEFAGWTDSAQSEVA